MVWSEDKEGCIEILKNPHNFLLAPGELWVLKKKNKKQWSR